MGSFLSKLERIFDRNPVRVVMLGLDAAGKTTIIYKLKLRNTSHTTPTTYPTVGFNVDMVRLRRGLTLVVWDIGGQQRVRSLWRLYLKDVQGLIYVVDSTDRERFAEAYTELQEILEAPEMSGVPVIVLANKQDLPQAATCSQVADALSLNDLYDREWHIRGTSGLTGDGLYGAMEHLAALSKAFSKSQRSFVQQ